MKYLIMNTVFVDKAFLSYILIKNKYRNILFASSDL